jgi:hypothetical protein
MAKRAESEFRAALRETPHYTDLVAGVTALCRVT